MSLLGLSVFGLFILLSLLSLKVELFHNDELPSSLGHIAFSAASVPIGKKRLASDSLRSS